MVERKAFTGNPKHQYRDYNMENMIVVPITKIIKIIMSIKFVSFHERILITRKMTERKAFLAIPKHQDHAS